MKPRSELKKVGSHTKKEWDDKKKEFENCCSICGVPEDLIETKIIGINNQKIRELNSKLKEKERKFNNEAFLKSFKEDLKNNIDYCEKLIKILPKILEEEINLSKKYLEKKDFISIGEVENFLKERKFPPEINGKFGNKTDKFISLNSEIKALKSAIEKTRLAYSKSHYYKLQKDHIKEVQELGYVWNDIENIQPLCALCNYQKGIDTKLQLYLRQNFELKNIIKNLKPRMKFISEK